ncbi:MAG: DUF1015 family protein [Chitinophagales bacterium]
MATVKPFRGLRPQPQLAAEVAALPYDVMNSREARVMAAGKPHSFLHVSRAEIDLPENVDVHSQQVYDKARDNFKKFIAEGILFQDDTPCYYLYAQTMNGRRQAGFVGCSAVEDYYNNIIKKHEFTRPEKEEDRIAHMKAVSAHVGPIFLTFQPNEKLRLLAAETLATAPVYDFVAEDGIRHQFWVISDAEKVAGIETIFSREVPFTYIADGHHRTASAARVGTQLKNENARHTGKEEYNFFLSVLFAADELAIMDYNRVVKDLNGLSDDNFLQRAGEKFSIEKISASENRPQKLHEITMFFNQQWYRLVSLEGTFENTPIGVLDVSILQQNLLSPVLGIDDPRTNNRIEFVGGIRGLGELEKRVNSGEMTVAFALYPVSLQQLIDIADSGEVMPPKSTWFEPKLRDGLVSHLF